MNPNNPPSVVNCAVYDRKARRRDIALEDVSEVLAKNDGRFVWIGLYEPQDDLLGTLQQELGLHDLAAEDALKAHQRPKVERYGPGLFVVMHTAQNVDGRVQFGETHAFLGPRYLLTIRHGASASYAGARNRCEREPELLALGPAYGLYAVLDAIVDNYLPLVEEFGTALDDLEQDIFAEEFQRDTIVRLYELKREMTRLRLAVSPLQDVLSQLVHTHGDLVPDPVRPYFRDVLDHALRVNDANDALRETVTSAMTVNLSVVTIRQGEVVKRLAGWAALLAAPTLAASWYGMNFVHMPELSGRWSYWILAGAVAVICVGLYAYLKKVRWL